MDGKASGTLQKGINPNNSVMQSRIRQARVAKNYMFGYLIPRSYKGALEFDKENNNIKWTDASREEIDCIKEQQVFTRHQKVKWD